MHLRWHSLLLLLLVVALDAALLPSSRAWSRAQRSVANEMDAASEAALQPLIAAVEVKPPRRKQRIQPHQRQESAVNTDEPFRALGERLDQEADAALRVPDQLWSQQPKEAEEADRDKGSSQGVESWLVRRAASSGPERLASWLIRKYDEVYGVQEPDEPPPRR